MARAKVNKGNYYRKRTKDWLESEGYTVEIAEVAQRVYRRNKDTGELDVLYLKRDLWGADLVARNADHLIFIQVKSNPGDITRGIRQLSRGPWPPFVGRWVVYWPPRRRLREGPEVEVVAG